MSRSHRKFLSWSHSEFDPPEWDSFRVKERQCIKKRLHNPEHEEVIFPRYYGSGKGSWFASKRYYHSKADTRDSYFKEIRNILNGYYEDGRWGQNEDHRQDFIEAYNKIKKGVSPDGKDSRFEWLNTREAKEAVKNWDGDPLDVLYYLTRSGIIEKAVRYECKRISRK